MATLTETAYYARQGVKYGSVGFVALLVLWFVSSSFLTWWKATHPDPLPPPTMDFGRLSAIEFPSASIENSFEYIVETPNGRLDEISDRMLVFKAPTKKTGFLDPDRAIELARKMGFLFDPAQPSETLYRWTTSNPLPTLLEVDIVSGNFKLKRSWQSDPAIVISRRFISDKQVILDAQAYLRTIGLLDNDLVGKEQVSYFRAQGEKLVPALSLSEADFAMVDFFRKDYQIINEDKEILAQYSFFTPKPDEGVVRVLLSGVLDDKNKQIIEVVYNHVTINYEEKAEYPVKTVKTALEELKSGGGYIASFEGTGQVVIRRVELGYFDSSLSQDHEMPIYIFKGDDNFVAYVSAVDDRVLEVDEKANVVESDD